MDTFQLSSVDVTINLMEKQARYGKLFIVATHLGNPRDITLRALDILKSVNAVICEEYRQGSRLLKQLGIQNELLTLNEHNEIEETQHIVARLAAGESMAIVSDAGTPVFADPGMHLLEQVYQMNIPVSPIPGPASLIAALSLCDFPIDRFVFAGFPPRKTEVREKFLQKYLVENIPIVLMDTPYRLTKLLTEVETVFGKNQDILLACDLTLNKETVFRGSVDNILRKVSGQKREFILILNRNQQRRSH